MIADSAVNQGSYLADILQRIGIGAVTVIPLLAVVLFGLIEVWRSGAPIRRSTYTRLFVQVALLGGAAMAWVITEVAAASTFRPPWRVGALRIAAMASGLSMLLSVTLLAVQVFELAEYVRSAMGRERSGGGVVK